MVGTDTALGLRAGFLARVSRSDRKNLRCRTSGRQAPQWSDVLHRSISLGLRRSRRPSDALFGTGMHGPFVKTNKTVQQTQRDGPKNSATRAQRPSPPNLLTCAMSNGTLRVLFDLSGGMQFLPYCRGPNHGLDRGVHDLVTICGR